MKVFASKGAQNLVYLNSGSISQGRIDPSFALKVKVDDLDKLPKCQTSSLLQGPPGCRICIEMILLYALYYKVCYYMSR